MGYNVAMMADSTSRWGEALREVSGRLEEMPGEEGYPAYLATRLAAFYERVGPRAAARRRGRRADRLGHDGRRGLAGRRRHVRADDAELAARHRRLLGARHLAGAPPPLPGDQLDQELHALPRPGAAAGTRRTSPTTGLEYRDRAMSILQKETELQEIVQLVGPDALPESEKVILEVARMLREDFLQQFAFDEVDAYCPPKKQYWLLQDDHGVPRRGHRRAEPRRLAAARSWTCRCATRSPTLKTTPHEEALERMQELVRADRRRHRRRSRCTDGR